MKKVIDPITGREVKTKKEWESIPARRRNSITYAVNHGIDKSKIEPALSDAESELYDSIAEDLIDYRKKYGDKFCFDDAVELEW